MVLIYRLTIVLFLLTALNSNTITHRDSKSYFHFVNLAEIHIINSDYKKASRCYNKAFETNHPGFSDDFFNALKVATITKNKRLAVFCLKKLAIMGLCKELLEEFFFLKNATDLWDEIMKLSKNAEKIHLDHYRYEIDFMHNADQDVRFERDSSVMAKTDSINFAKFTDLVKKYGFPSETKIGIACTANKKGIEPPPYNTILWHFAGRKYKGLKDIIDMALEKSEIDPYIYATYMNLLSPGEYYPSPVIKWDDGNYYKYYMSDSLETLVNKNRNAIGLPTVGEQVQEIKHRIKNGRNGFRIYTPIAKYDGLPEWYVKEKFVKIEL